MKLTHFKLCPASRTVRLILGELGLRFELEEAKPWAPSETLIELNPAASLPVLQLDDGTVFSSQLSLLEYLGDAQHEGLTAASALQARDFDAELSGTRALVLYPKDLDARAEVRRLYEWFATKCDREVTQEFIYEKVRAALEPSKAAPPDATMLKAARANLKYHLSYIGFLADQRAWLAGDTLTAIDFMAAAHLSVLDFLGEIHWSSYPQTQDWYQRLKSRPSFRPLLADKFPGLAPPAHYRELDF